MNDTSWGNRVVLAVLIVVTLAVRIGTLRTMDLGGDAAFKWFFVRSWRAQNHWIFDHHTARFAINLPTWLVQQALGSHPNGMYVTPLLASLAQLPLLYLIGRSLQRPAAAVWACLLMLPFEPQLIASSQLLPGIFQATWLLGALHACVCFALDPSARRHVVFAALWTFAAYLSMVTTFYFLPGLAFGIWLARRRFADVLWFGLALSGMIALETLAYAALSPYPFGQFQIILATHTDVAASTFWGLFDRYTVLPWSWRIALAVYALSGLALLRERARAFCLPWLLAWSGLLGMTFGVKHIGPLVPAIDFSIRYFDMLTPLLALCIGLALDVLLARRVGPALQLPAIVAVGALAFWLYRPPGAHALAITHAQWALLNRAYAANLPLVGANRSEHAQQKTLRCIQWAWLRDDLIERDGELQRRALGKLQRGKRTFLYTSREDLPPAQVARALEQAQCYVAVARRDAEPRLDLQVHGGPACAALSADGDALRAALGLR